MAQNTPSDPTALALAALRRPLQGRRFWSWLLFLAVLAALAVVPWWLSFEASKSEAAAPPSTASVAEHLAEFRTAHAWDRVWDAGPLDSAHSALSLDCRACHSEPFSRVRDEDCTACHQTVASHGGASPPLAGDPAPRCASCHQEHQGPNALALQNVAQSGPACVECHQDLSARKPNLALGNVADFSTAHPQFSVRVAQADGSLLKVRLGAGLVTEPTGLRFPHDVHVAASGVKGPKGDEILSCGDCHRSTPDALGFEPVKFETDCASCHALTLEASLDKRSVPHGSVSDALSMIREFYSFAASETNPAASTAANAAQRPGVVAAVDTRFVGRPGDALTLARAEAIDLFEKRACAVCHEVTRVAEQGPAGSPAADLPLWEIAPLAPVHAWMPGARFSHAAHVQSECSACHTAAESAQSSEVLMPAIEGCRTCHAGAEAKPTQVRSDCGLCHDYHPAHAALKESEILAGAPLHGDAP